MSFLANILKHSSQSVLAGVLNAAGSFVASVVVARLLGVEGTAAVAMALWLVFVSVILADVGISGALVRFAAQCPPDDDHAAARHLASWGLRMLLLAIFGGLLLLSAILYLYWGDIRAKYVDSEEEALLFCGLILLCFVVHMAYAFAYQLLRGLLAFQEITVFSLSGSVLQIVGVALGSLWYGVNGALAGYIVFSVPMILGLRRISFTRKVEQPADAARMRRYALSFYFAILFSPLLWVRADTLIVDQAIGAEAVGLFTAAGTLAALLIQVCQMICSALLPNIVHAGHDDPEMFDRSSRIAVRAALPLLLPACLIAAAAAPEAITLVFGPAFAGGATTAAILCLAGVGSALTLIVASVVSAGEDSRLLARNGMIGAVVTLISGTALALLLGIVGAALGRLLSQGVMGLLNVRSANQRVAGLITAAWVWRTLAAGTIAAGATEVVGWWLGGGSVALLASLAAGGVAYLLVAPILLPFSPEERRQILALLQPLPSAMRGPPAWLISLGRKL